MGQHFGRAACLAWGRHPMLSRPGDRHRHLRLGPLEAIAQRLSSRRLESRRSRHANQRTAGCAFRHAPRPRDELPERQGAAQPRARHEPRAGDDGARITAHPSLRSSIVFAKRSLDVAPGGCPPRPLTRASETPKISASERGARVAEHVVYIDRFEIRDDKLEDFKRYASDMASFVEEQEPGALSFNYYVNEAGSRGTAVFVFLRCRRVQRPPRRGRLEVPRGVRAERHRDRAAGAPERARGRAGEILRREYQEETRRLRPVALEADRPLRSQLWFVLGPAYGRRS